MVATATGIALTMRNDELGKPDVWHFDLLTVKSDGTFATHSMREPDASTQGARGLATVRVSDTELALDEHDAAGTTALSLTTRTPGVPLEVRALARATDGRFALVTVVGKPTETERADRSIEVSYKTVYPAITIARTAADLLPARAR